jgi:hypothetical protein
VGVIATAHFFAGSWVVAFRGGRQAAQSFHVVGDLERARVEWVAAVRHGFLGGELLFGQFALSSLMRSFVEGEVGAW